MAEKTIQIIKYDEADYEIIVRDTLGERTIEYTSHSKLTEAVEDFKKEGYMVRNDQYHG